MGMMDFPSVTMDPNFHSFLCLVFNSTVELFSLGKSRETFSFMGFGHKKIFLSKWCQSDEVIKKMLSIQSDAKECSLTMVPLARCSLRFML